jgi:hypothetical protein
MTPQRINLKIMDKEISIEDFARWGAQGGASKSKKKKKSSAKNGKKGGRPKKAKKPEDDSHKEWS